MRTVFEIIRPWGVRYERAVDLPEISRIEALRPIVQPFLDGGDLELIEVLLRGKEVDMFVDDRGLLKELTVNPRASRIYRRTMLKAWGDRLPPLDASALPPIRGTAVLFHRKVTA